MVNLVELSMQKILAATCQALFSAIFYGVFLVTTTGFQPEPRPLVSLQLLHQVKLIPTPPGARSGSTTTLALVLSVATKWDPPRPTRYFAWHRNLTILSHWWLDTQTGYSGVCLIRIGSFSAFCLNFAGIRIFADQFGRRRKKQFMRGFEQPLWMSQGHCHSHEMTGYCVESRIKPSLLLLVTLSG